MQNEKAVMLKEVALQPAFVRDNIAPMLAYMREVLRNREPGALRHGFAIGCGDSYAAAIAVRSYMMKATGRMIEPVEALEFSRYLVADLPAGQFRVWRLQFRHGVAHHRGRATGAREGRLDIRGHGQRRYKSREEPLKR